MKAGLPYIILVMILRFMSIIWCIHSTDNRKFESITVCAWKQPTGVGELLIQIPPVNNRRCARQDVYILIVSKVFGISIYLKIMLPP